MTRTPSPEHRRSAGLVARQIGQGDDRAARRGEEAERLVAHRGEDPRPDGVDVLGEEREEVRLAVAGERLEKPHRPHVEGVGPHHVAVLHHQDLDASAAYVHRSRPPLRDVERGTDRAADQVGLLRAADHADLDSRLLVDPVPEHLRIRGLAKGARCHGPDVRDLVPVDHPAEGAEGVESAVPRRPADLAGEEDVRSEPDRGADVLEHARLVVFPHLHQEAAHRVGSHVDGRDPRHIASPPGSSTRWSTSAQSAR